MKPILYNTEMVRAIQTGTKTATRRVVKPQPTFFYSYGGNIADPDNPDNIAFLAMTEKNKEDKEEIYVPPYSPGDILYVRETWANLLYRDGHTRYVYKATDTYPFGETIVLQFRWHPSIHMPREAARIFLRVTDIKVQRVQDITEEEAREEDCKDREDFQRVWDGCYAKPRPVKVKGVIDHYESYPWEDIQETRTYRGKPWYVIGDPWTWAIEFERCEKPEKET